MFVYFTVSKWWTFQFFKSKYLKKIVVKGRNGQTIYINWFPTQKLYYQNQTENKREIHVFLLKKGANVM